MKSTPKFCTAINCMDGRIQIPVIRYLQQRFNVEYVDTITEAGPNLILSDNTNTALIQSIYYRLKISVENHHSVGIAIIGHYDCAGNPASQEKQIEDIQRARMLLHQQYDKLEIIGLWVDEEWEVHEIKTK
jgi:carbonic anhydrase